MVPTFPVYECPVCGKSEAFLLYGDFVGPSTTRAACCIDGKTGQASAPIFVLDLCMDDLIEGSMKCWSCHSLGLLEDFKVEVGKDVAE